MSRQTLEQTRVRYALDKVRKHAPKDGQDPDKATKRYASLVRSLPTMVLQNGLGQAMAFLLADAEGHFDRPAGQLYKEVEDWLCGTRSPYHPERVYAGDSGLMDDLCRGNRFDYQRAQEVSLALLAWMRKFADAYLRAETGQ